MYYLVSSQLLISRALSSLDSFDTMCQTWVTAMQFRTEDVAAVLYAVISVFYLIHVLNVLVWSSMPDSIRAVKRSSCFVPPQLSLTGH